MTNQYDELGLAYHETKTIPLFRCLDATFKEHLGDIRGFRVLDLACGGGDYSRKLVSWGAEHVTGIDLSPGMIDSAKQLTGNDARIEYLVGDCSKPLVNIAKAGFDLVFGAYLLNYSSDQQQMTAMWDNISAHLKPEGRFVGSKPTWFPEAHEDRYGLTNEKLEMVPGGFSQRTYLGPQKVNFVNYVLSWDIYREGAKRSGMQELKIEPTVLPEAEEGDEFWKSILDEPLFEVVTAVRR